MTEQDLDALVVRLAPVIRAAVADALDAQRTPEYADKFSNPCGSERAFLDAARRKDFPSFRRRRLITARWADVTAAIERRPGAAKKRPGPEKPDAHAPNIQELVEASRPRPRGTVSAHA